jgi:hypothetical protein
MNTMVATTTARPTERHYTVLFSIPFKAEMTARVRGLLSSLLHMTLGFDRKPVSAQQGPGFARLNFSSGLLLLPGAADDEWVVECRSSHPPGSAVIHRWEVDTASVLRLIDGSVPIPPVAGQQS